MRGKQCRGTDIHHWLATSLKKVAGAAPEFEGSVARLSAVLDKHSQLQTLCLTDRPIW